MLHRHVGILESLRLPLCGIEQLGQTLGDHHLTGGRAGAADLRPTRQFTIQIGSKCFDIRAGLFEQSGHQPILLIDQCEQQVLSVDFGVAHSGRNILGFLQGFS